VTIRYVDVTNQSNDNEIYVAFLRFISTDVSSGKGITDVIRKFLEKNKFELKECRRHGYDSAANMRAKIAVYKREL
jgi:hypothetical protein